MWYLMQFEYILFVFKNKIYLSCQIGLYLIPVAVCQSCIFYFAYLELSLWQRLQSLHTCAMLGTEGPMSHQGLLNYHYDVSYHYLLHLQKYLIVTSHFHFNNQI